MWFVIRQLPNWFGQPYRRGLEIATDSCPGLSGWHIPARRSRVEQAAENRVCFAIRGQAGEHSLVTSR